MSTIPRCRHQPVLVTSLSRRQWGDDGKFTPRWSPTSKSSNKSPRKNNVPLIDLHAAPSSFTKTRQRRLQRAFAQETRWLDDNTHLNAKGSQVVGPIVAAELKKAVPELAPHIK